MRLDLFEQIRPLCPRCLHFSQAVSPLKIAERAGMRAGVLWHGMIHCGTSSCWAEYPVIDGIPIIVPDVPAYLTTAQAQILARRDLPPLVAAALGDALGQGTPFDTDRQHLNLYATSHFADWAGGETAPLAGIVTAMLGALDDPGPDDPAPELPAPELPALDLGCSVGRGTWEIAHRTGRPTLGLDLNFAMLRLAQELLVEGTAHYDRRRIGLVYDPVEIVVPAGMDPDRLDFWAADCTALGLRAGSFGLAGAVNLVDCIAAPTNMLHEAARVLAPGAPAFFTTPYDWAETATEKAAWMGGHSSRGPLGGAGEPVLTATLEQAGFEIDSQTDDLPWTLRIHQRAEMRYALHAVRCRKRGAAAAELGSPFD